MAASLLFVVIKAFTDLQDNKHVYKPGDFYPRKESKLDEKRAKELASADNARNESLIVQVVQPNQVEVFPKHTGGGYYELSDGSKAQGKEAAEEAQAKLDQVEVVPPEDESQNQK